MMGSSFSAENGFIEIVSSGYAAKRRSIYRFSDRWQNGSWEAGNFILYVATQLHVYVAVQLHMGLISEVYM